MNLFNFFFFLIISFKLKMYFYIVHIFSIFIHFVDLLSFLCLYNYPIGNFIFMFYHASHLCSHWLPHLWLIRYHNNNINFFLWFCPFEVSYGGSFSLMVFYLMIYSCLCRFSFIHVDFSIIKQNRWNIFKNKR